LLSGLRSEIGVDVTAEDHLAGRRLQHTGDDDVDGLADHLARIVHDHHRPIVEIGDALVVFLALLEDEDLHDLAGENNRFERVRQLVDVEYFDAAQLRHLVEIEVVGDDLSLQRAGEFDQFQVYFADFRVVGVGNRHLDPGHLLNLLQDVEAAPAPISFHRISRVGDKLQFFEDELRDDQRAVHESGVAQIGDAAVDDHGRIQNLVAALWSGGAEEADEPRRFEPFTFAAANDEPEIGQQQQDESVQKGDALIRGVRPEQRGTDALCHKKADASADERAQHVRESQIAQSPFEKHGNARQNQTECEIDDRIGAKGS
jgi:hypothetical protein